MLAGGAEAALSPLGVSGFISARHYLRTTHRTRLPGLLTGSGTGSLWARGPAYWSWKAWTMPWQEGAHIYGEIVGYGATSDAYHILSLPLEEGSTAMREAMKDADRPETSIHQCPWHFHSV